MIVLAQGLWENLILLWDIFIVGMCVFGQILQVDGEAVVREYQSCRAKQQRVPLFHCLIEPKRHSVVTQAFTSVVIRCRHTQRNSCLEDF